MCASCSPLSRKRTGLLLQLPSGRVQAACALTLHACAQRQMDIFSLKAPNQQDSQAETHTVLELRYTPEDDSPQDSLMARPLIYNENVRLAVRPDQPEFIVQKADVFCVKQFDVVRRTSPAAAAAAVLRRCTGSLLVRMSRCGRRAVVRISLHV